MKNAYISVGVSQNIGILSMFMLMGGSFLEEIGEMLIGKTYVNESFTLMRIR